MQEGKVENEFTLPDGLRSVAHELPVAGAAVPLDPQVGRERIGLAGPFLGGGIQPVAVKFRVAAMAARTAAPGDEHPEIEDRSPHIGSPGHRIAVQEDRDRNDERIEQVRLG